VGWATLTSGMQGLACRGLTDVTAARRGTSQEGSTEGLAVFVRHGLRIVHHNVTRLGVRALLRSSRG
jgi:hypothetical protein